MAAHWRVIAGGLIERPVIYRGPEWGGCVEPWYSCDGGAQAPALGGRLGSPLPDWSSSALSQSESSHRARFCWEAVENSVPVVKGPLLRYLGQLLNPGAWNKNRNAVVAQCDHKNLFISTRIKSWDENLQPTDVKWLGLIKHRMDWTLKWNVWIDFLVCGGRAAQELTPAIPCSVSLPHWDSAQHPAGLWPGPARRLSPTGRRKLARDRCCLPGSPNPETGGRRCGRLVCHLCSCWPRQGCRCANGRWCGPPRRRKRTGSPSWRLRPTGTWWYWSDVYGKHSQTLFIFSKWIINCGKTGCRSTTSYSPSPWQLNLTVNFALLLFWWHSTSLRLKTDRTHKWKQWKCSQQKSVNLSQTAYLLPCDSSSVQNGWRSEVLTPDSPRGPPWQPDRPSSLLFVLAIE